MSTDTKTAPAAASKPQSLQDILDAGPNIVDRLFRNPPKNALTVYTQMMPGDAVRPEFSTWRDEQTSWRKTVALHDQSYHMHSLHVRGPKALDLLQGLAVNTFKNFAPGAAKQFLACSPEGHVIGDAILYHLEENHFIVVGNPATTDWVQFHAEKQGVEHELDAMWALNRAKKRVFYRYQIEGANAFKLLEELHGGPLPEIKFFRTGVLNIAGCKVTAMGHSMGGVPGMELSGPWDERSVVKKALVEAGKKHGLRQIGSLAYFTTVIESGWWAVPVSAVYTSQDPIMVAFRKWLTGNHAVSRMSLGGSFYSPNIEDWYVTPWDIGHGHLVKFDHDYIGRAALEKMADQPHRQKVTLVWNAEDVMAVVQSQLEDAGDTPPLPITFPLAATARLHYDRVTDKDGKTIGLSHYPGYTVNERAMMSLGSIDAAFAEPGTEVVLVWGEDGGGSRSPGLIEPHKQVKIRATVAPSPISRAAQSYRSTIGKIRNAI